MKINKNTISLTALNLGFISIAIGIYFWAYWGGWYDSNRTCEHNWRFQFATFQTLNIELMKEFENHPKKSAILQGLVNTYRRNVSGDMYSGYNKAMPLKAIGICLCIIGLFLMLSAITNQYINVPEKSTVFRKYKPFFVAIFATLFLCAIIWGIYHKYQEYRFSQIRIESMRRRICLNYYLLTQLQKTDKKFAPVSIVEKLRSDVGMYLFRKKERSIPENRTCEEATKWLISHKIEIPEIKQDGNSGMMKVWTPLRNKPIKIDKNSNK